MSAICLITLSLVLAILTGCGGVSQVKKQIAADLSQIVDYQDCPTVCEALKKYVETRLAQ